MVIIDVILQIVIGVAVALLSAIVIDFRNSWNKDRRQQNAESLLIKNSIRVILRKELDDIYTEHMCIGYIPLEKLKLARLIYDHYHQNGGNGTGTMEIEKLEQLPNEL